MTDFGRLSVQRFTSSFPGNEVMNNWDVGDGIPRSEAEAMIWFCDASSPDAIRVCIRVLCYVSNVNSF